MLKQNVPGAVKNLTGSTEGYKCDKHPEEDAAFRVQGETDSFGAEYLYMCTGCFEEYVEEECKPDIGLVISVIHLIRKLNLSVIQKKVIMALCMMLVNHAVKSY